MIRLLIFFVMMFGLNSSFAGSATPEYFKHVYFSYNANQATLHPAPLAESAVKTDNYMVVQYFISSLPVSIKAEDFRFSPNYECIQWSQPSVDEENENYEAECTKERFVDYSIFNGNRYDIFEIERSIFNVTTGEVKREVLPGKMVLYIHRRSFVVDPAMKKGTKLKLQDYERFDAYVSNYGLSNCADQGVVQSAPLSGENANLSICMRMGGKAVVEKRGQTFSVSLIETMNYEVSVTGNWVTTKEVSSQGSKVQRVWPTPITLSGKVQHTIMRD